ncbi:MAG: shikimate dehydrogenase [Nitrososphaeria archaeon]
MNFNKIKVCCVIGDPIEHTLSPLIHNKAFQYLGLDFVYVAFKVKKEALKKAVDGMRAFNIRGMNVTIPHKVRVADYLDAVDEAARDIGAVNTIVNDNGRLTGYNTDADAAVKALTDNDIILKDKKVIVLGAGGAARAITFSIAKEKPDQIVILNRTRERAKELAEHILRKTGTPVTANGLDHQSMTRELRNADLVINCTPIGMSPNIDQSPIPRRLLRREMTVMDAVYNPLETRLLKDAREASSTTVSGIDMFIHQAASAFEMWTGQKAPDHIMREVAVQALKGDLR